VVASVETSGVDPDMFEAESKTLATMHVAITNDSISEFMSAAQKITEVSFLLLL
jgi:hypothetical protein